MNQQYNHQEIAPPKKSAAPLKWLRENLFNSWLSAVLTFLALLVFYVVLKGVLIWVFTEAQWNVIPANLSLFLTGAYPRGEMWRVWVSLCTLAILAGFSAGIWGGPAFRFTMVFGGALLLLAALPFSPTTRRWLILTLVLLVTAFSLGRGRGGLKKWLIVGWVASFPWIIILLKGFGDNALLPSVLTTQWGGLMLTLVLAVVGIAASFPLGILLALGRRSRLPAVRFLCTIYIETIRGVPLVTILFMAQVMLPIFIPDFRIDKILRAMIGLTFFSAAYMAENVRGGLQGVPQGQYEAAKALGLSYPRAMWLVILPQALRSVIPTIVGQFISLFKDTSLVAVIGLLDLLGIARSVMANPDWLGLQAEVYLFAAVLYFMFSYSMSTASRRIEVKLGAGERG